LDGLPEVPSGKRYFEAFLGAASVFLALKPAAARVSDLNAHLIGS
jgi:site-specific DNA-adenine methylase